MSQILEEDGHLSHRAKRKLRKKLARQLVRRRNAQLRDQSLGKDIVTEEEVALIQAEEELEKERHDEEERKWIERERIAQELFAQKKALEETEQKRRQEIQKNALTKETVVQTSSFQASVILPPNHCPEPPHLNWKREKLCQFFWKTGACRYGDRCSRHHSIPPLYSFDDIASLGLSRSIPPRLILIIENMFNHFSLQCDPLEVDEAQLLIDYRDFYADVRPELENVCGGRLETFRCCRNALPHLRGNVYIQFTQDLTVASDIAMRLSTRFYDGKQLVTRLAYLGEGWESAICGCQLRGKCARGDTNCNYLHIFLNPGERADSILTTLSSSNRANEKLSRESRGSISRSDSDRHSTRHRRHSQERHQHKSRERKSSNRHASERERPSKNRSRSKERLRNHKSKHRRSDSKKERSSSKHRSRSP